MACEGPLWGRGIRHTPPPACTFWLLGTLGRLHCLVLMLHDPAFPPKPVSADQCFSCSVAISALYHPRKHIQYDQLRLTQLAFSIEEGFKGATSASCLRVHARPSAVRCARSCKQRAAGSAQSARPWRQQSVITEIFRGCDWGAHD